MTDEKRAGDFGSRLKQAIDRGQKRAAAQSAADQKKQLSESEVKNRHNQFRLQLSEHIEGEIKQLVSHFPGFQFETLYGDRGWGGAVYRDDLRQGKQAFYSRLELTVRPLNKYHVVDIAAKGTIRNKEIFSRNYYEDIQVASLEKFMELIDAWILEYAEQFAAS